MFVKICGITSEDDALLAVAMGADAVGFVFAPSPRQVPVQQVYDITRRLPAGDPDRRRVPRRAPQAGRRDRAPLRRQGRQLHGNESPTVVAEVAKAVRFVVKAYPAGSPLIAAVGRRSPPTRS